MLSRKWDTVSPSPKLRNYHWRGNKGNVRVWGQGLVLWCAVFYARQGHCPIELRASMIPCTRSAQDWSGQCPVTEGRGTRKVSPLPENVQVVNGCWSWGRDTFFCGTGSHRCMTSGTWPDWGGRRMKKTDTHGDRERHWSWGNGLSGGEPRDSGSSECLLYAVE